MRDILFLKHVGLILGLAFLVILANLSDVSATNKQFITTSTDETVAVAISIAPYTPLVKVDAATLKSALDGDSSGVIQKPTISATIYSPTHYTVEKGDTVTGIAQKNDISTATILDANNINVADIAKISVGTVLTIPAKSTTDSLDWLNKLNEQKAKEAAELAKNRALASRNSSAARSAVLPTQSKGNQGTIVPIHYKMIARGVGWDGGEYHTGIDYDAAIGTPVVAAKTGRVAKLTSAWTGTAWGNSIVLNHGGNITTRYAHLSKISVHVGQTVQQGEVIGYSGNTGNSTGPHLHFEMRYGNSIMNPYTGVIMRK